MHVSLFPPPEDTYQYLLWKMSRAINAWQRGPGAYTTHDTSPLRDEEVRRWREYANAEVRRAAEALTNATPPTPPQDAGNGTAHAG